jgi:hypothetical protein
MQKRPNHFACLGEVIIGISGSGFLMRQDKEYKAYWKPTAGQCLAITWEVYTLEQLEAAAAAAAAAAQSAGEGAGNGNG